MLLQMGLSFFFSGVFTSVAERFASTPLFSLRIAATAVQVILSRQASFRSR